MNIIESLNWRYATKKYTDQKVEETAIDRLVETINLTASSCGLQPYRLFVVSNPEVKSKLSEGSFNGQITNSSHLLVFAALNDVSKEYITSYYEMVEQSRGLPNGSLAEMTNNLIAYFGANTAEQNANWAAKQAYIALGTALIAAADLRIDATPMEGFDATVFDESLGLKEKGLHAAVIMSVGYRDEANDFLVNAKKVRLPINEFVTKID